MWNVFVIEKYQESLSKNWISNDESYFGEKLSKMLGLEKSLVLLGNLATRFDLEIAMVWMEIEKIEIIKKNCKPFSK